MTRDYITPPVSTANALKPRACRCDKPMGQNGQCWKCGHAIARGFHPNRVETPRPKAQPEPGPVEVTVQPSWEQMARVLEER